MKTLQLYLLRQTLLTLMMTLAVFTFVLLLGNVLKEIFMLLATRQASIGIVAQAVGLLFPYVMGFALPFSFLTATLLVFGRLSADNELTAIRASGLSLVAFVMPLILFSVAATALCGLFNMKIAPECRGSYRALINQVLVQKSMSFLSEDRFIVEIPGMVLYMRKINGDQLEDVRWYQLKENKMVARLNAEGGKVTLDPQNRKISLYLTNVVVEFPETGNSFLPSTNLTATATSTNSLEESWHIFRTMEFWPDPIDISTLIKTPEKPRLSDMSFADLQEEVAQRKRQGISPMPALVQMHRQLAFSFACVGFTLIAIPLGIRAHRRETSVGIAIALGLVIVYYGFFILAESLQSRPAFHPHLIFWIPNILFQLLGGFMLFRANRQ